MPAGTGVKEKSAAFSFFPKPKLPTPATPKKVETPADTKKSTTFSFFSKPKKPATPATPKKVETPADTGVKEKSPAFSFFSKPKPKPATPATPKKVKTPAETGVKEKTRAFSFFSKPKPKDSTPPSKSAKDIPILKNAVQNSDGSVTGNVFNRKGFRNGTEITTSPVRKGAKPGMIVKTGSGSEYQLE